MIRKNKYILTGVFESGNLFQDSLLANSLEEAISLFKEHLDSQEKKNVVKELDCIKRDGSILIEEEKAAQQEFPLKVSTVDKLIKILPMNIVDRVKFKADLVEEGMMENNYRPGEQPFEIKER